ncbi:PilN domain-containing protein [Glaciecola petra]|uniref:PilN domain-containing protein n=1 Tax=Glaciecola petra TaxID=3075602 RepID=A0ABU2ZSC1_9ALTE|nr:PilN domain-containing protein [Aestuariibacter sp. P117]MDT0595527.1 PilN domain-containing protein [Aestuariibacter sp. P117]
MAKINLLPWREGLRQTQKKQYIGSLVGLSVGVFILFWLAGQIFDQQIRNQNSRNNYLKQQIGVLDQQISEISEITEARDAISLRMALIEQLQVSRNLTPLVFDELARLVPAGVSFSSMRRTQDNIKIIGVSESNNRLSAFMREIEESEVFVSPELSSIVADKSGINAISDFELQFSIAPQYASVDVETTDEDKEK